MEQRYTGVVTRLLDESERAIHITETQTPLVIEPLHSTGSKFLQEFLASYSSQIIEDIAAHGAVLLRGFDVKSATDFEKTVLSIDGLHGMSEVMMSEPGRIVVEGTKFVLHTNTLYKTGGTLVLGGFHTENYYAPDVPRFISFFCMKPSWFGGETGLINAAQLYIDLPDTLKAKLEHQAYHVNSLYISDIIERYGLSSEEIEEFCTKVGLTVHTDNDIKRVVIYKPSVIEHPITKERALMINISAELDRLGLNSAINLRAFWPDYLNFRWIIHRFAWRFFSSNGQLLFSLKLQGALYELRALQSLLWDSINKILTKKTTNITNTPPPLNTPPLPRVGSAFTQEEIELLAIAMRRRYSSFLWKPGDVLIIDNLKMAHAGMPGFGLRELKALICNPIPLPYSADAPGLYAPLVDEIRECLGAQLVALKK